MPYAELPGYKKLDAAIRDAVSGFVHALEHVEPALARRLPEAEKRILEDVQQRCKVALKEAQEIRSTLWKCAAE